MLLPRWVKIRQSEVAYSRPAAYSVEERTKYRLVQSVELRLVDLLIGCWILTPEIPSSNNWPLLMELVAILGHNEHIPYVHSSVR